MCYFKNMKNSRFIPITLSILLLAGLPLVAPARVKKSAYDKEREQRIRQNHKELEQESRQERWQELKTERRLGVAEIKSDLKDDPTIRPKQWFTTHVMGRYAVVDGRPSPLVPIRGKVERVIDSNTVAVALASTTTRANVRQPPVIVALQAKRSLRVGEPFALPNAVRAGSRDYPWKDNSYIPVKVYKESPGITYKEYQELVQNGYAFPER